MEAAACELAFDLTCLYLLTGGPKFGDNGYFRISYGTCGVGSLGDMYGA